MSYYQENKERILARQKLYYEKKKEERKEYQIKYNNEKRDKIDSYNTEYYKKNKERLKEKRDREKMKDFVLKTTPVVATVSETPRTQMKRKIIET